MTSISVNRNDPQTANGLFKGFCTIDGSHELWHASNLENNNPDVVVPADYEQHVLPRLKALRPAIVRKFIDLAAFAPEPGKYDPSGPRMQGLYRTIKDANALGATVIVNFTITVPWIAGPKFFPRSDAEIETWSTVVTDFMKALTGRGCRVRYLQIQNEQDILGGAGLSVLLRVPMTVLRKKLDAAGLRVQFFAPGFYGPPPSQASQGVNALQAPVPGYPDVDHLISFYDKHTWYGHVPPDYDWRLEEPTMIAEVKALRDAAAKYADGSPCRKQVWDTEFGDYETGNDRWEKTPLFTIAALNHGLASIGMWQLTNTNYGYPGYPGTGGLLNTKMYGFAPKTAYWVWQIISTAVERESIVFHNGCTEAGLGALRAAACESPEGAQTVFVYNLDLAEPASFSVRYLGPSTRFATIPPQVMKRRLVDPAHPPSTLIGPGLAGIKIERDTFSDTIPAGAFAVYRGQSL